MVSISAAQASRISLPGSGTLRWTVRVLKVGITGVAASEVNTLVGYVNAFLSGTPQDDKARHLFQANCAVCHGREGKGNGPVAQSIQPAPADFTDPKFMRASSTSTKNW